MALHQLKESKYCLASSAIPRSKRVSFSLSPEILSMGTSPEKSILFVIVEFPLFRRIWLRFWFWRLRFWRFWLWRLRRLLMCPFSPPFEVTFLFVVIHMIGVGHRLDIICCIGTSVSLGLSMVRILVRTSGRVLGPLLACELFPLLAQLLGRLARSCHFIDAHGQIVQKYLILHLRVGHGVVVVGGRIDCSICQSTAEQAGKRNGADRPHPCGNVNSTSEEFPNCCCATVVPISIEARCRNISHIRVLIERLRVERISIRYCDRGRAPVRRHESTKRIAVVPRAEVVEARFGIALF